MLPFLQSLHAKALTLIVSLPVNDPALCEAAFDAGADAVKVHINVGHRASGTRFGRLKEELPALSAMLERSHGPIGLVLGGSLEQAALDAREADWMPFAFFSAYAHHMPPFAMGSKPLMAACDGSYSPGEIRRMETMGAAAVEASIVPADEYGQPLSLRDLLRYADIARETALPVVVPTQRAISPQDVPALVRSGVRGVMIGAIVTGKEQKSLVSAVSAFRKAIESACRP